MHPAPPTVGTRNTQAHLRTGNSGKKESAKRRWCRAIGRMPHCAVRRLRHPATARRPHERPSRDPSLARRPANLEPFLPDNSLRPRDGGDRFSRKAGADPKAPKGLPPVGAKPRGMARARPRLRRSCPAARCALAMLVAMKAWEDTDQFGPA